MSENLNKLFSPVLVIEDLSDSTKTIDKYDTGKIFTLSRALGITISLPNVADVESGFFVRFVVKVAPTNGSGIGYLINVTSGDGDNLHGTVVVSEDTAGGSTSGTATDVVTFVKASAEIGDFVDLTTDGTYWYASGHASLAASLTYT
jgi:hypothetical protein